MNVSECSICRKPMLPGGSDIVRKLVCTCGAGELATTAGMAPESHGDAPEPASRSARARARNLKLPGLQPGKQSVALRETEAGLQAAIVQALTLLRFTVLQTSEHRRGQTCPRCGEWNVLAGGRGTSRGVPDLLVADEDWPDGMWLGLEIKTPQGRVSPAQQALADRRRIIMVRSVEEAIVAIGKFEKAMIG